MTLILTIAEEDLDCLNPGEESESENVEDIDELLYEGKGNFFYTLK